MSRITDPDVAILATHATNLKNDYQQLASPWEGSPFAWICSLPSASRGAIGVKMISGWLATKGFDVTRSPDSEADRLVNGVRTEVKFSTLWKAGVYKFQQLRDQNYRFVICLGVSPFDAHCWVMNKEVVFASKGKAAGLTGQHGGGGGKDTAWLTVSPARIPAWLNEHGGRLSQAAALVTKLTGRKPAR